MPAGDFAGEGLGEADLPGFGGGVVGLSGVAGESDYGGYVDDASVALAEHQRDGETGGQEGAAQVDGDYFVPVGGGHTHYQAVAVDAGVVDQDVQSSETVGGGFDDGFGGVFVGDVAGDAEGFAAGGADGVDDGVGGVGVVAVVDGDGGAGGGEAAGNGGADAAGGSRYEGDLPAQVNGVHGSHLS